MKRNTVFIIGAGASQEANLPAGRELKEQIYNLLDIRFEFPTPQLKSGDYDIVAALRILVREPNGQRGDINPYVHEAHIIREALPLAISIDNFIDAHRGNEKIAICAKLAIVRSILKAEKNSLLYFDRSQSNSNIYFNNLKSTWYLPFFQILTENCEKQDLKDRLQSITLIIFNYDRCIEHFMYYALQTYYKISNAEAADIVNNINIYHPYGIVGSLPWSDQSDAIEFGSDTNPEQLLQLAKKIKTFAEGTDPKSSEILAIKTHMSNADRLVFIGFAFHKLNMKLIAPGNQKNNDKTHMRCFATTYNISESDKEVIKDQINDLYNSKIDTRMANLPCSLFFTEFWRSLSF